MKLLENFKKKDMKKFWCEVANAKKHNLPVPQNIDGRCDPVDVCNLFSEKYRKFFNKDRKESHLIKMNLTEKKKIELIMIICVDDHKEKYQIDERHNWL